MKKAMVIKVVIIVENFIYLNHISSFTSIGKSGEIELCCYVMLCYVMLYLVSLQRTFCPLCSTNYGDPTPVP